MKNYPEVLSLYFFLVSLIVYELVVNLSNDLYVPAIRDIMHTFYIGEDQAKLTIVVWFVGAMILNPILGVMSDILGSRKTLLWSGASFLLSTFFCILIKKAFLLFLFARFFQGVSAAAIVIAGYSIIHEFCPEKKAVLVVSYLSAILILAPLLGPLLGSLILYFHNDWHILFAILFLLALILFATLYFSVPEELSGGGRDKKLSIINLSGAFYSYVEIVFKKDFILPTAMAAILFSIIIFWIVASPVVLLVDFHYSSLFFSLSQLAIFLSYIFGILTMKYFLSCKAGSGGILAIGNFLTCFLFLILSINHFLLNFNLLILFLSFLSFAFLSGLFSGIFSRVIVNISSSSSAKSIAVFDLFCGLLSLFLISIRFSDRNNLSIIYLVLLACSTIFMFLFIFFGKSVLSKLGVFHESCL